MTRRNVIKGLLGVILAGLFASVYAVFIEPAVRLRVKRWRLTPEGWDAPPLRIAVLTDFHLCEPYCGRKRVAQIVARTNALNPDLIVLLGDFPPALYYVQEYLSLRDVDHHLGKLRARHGVFAVLGNHDWWDDRAAQRRGGGENFHVPLLEAQGIRVLSNAAVKLGDAGIWLAGLEDQLALERPDGNHIGLDDLPGTLAQITDEAPVVLLAHEPDIFPQVPQRVALTLSGHTHAGQVRIAGFSPVVPSKFGNRFAYGLVKEGRKSLVVSGGLGCSIFPVRFGTAPEITLVELAAPGQ